MASGLSVLDALTGVPRLSESDWQGTGWLVRWVIASRASVLSMTCYSVLIAGLAGLLFGGFHPGLWLLCAVGLCLAHAANNQLNDLVDTLVGVDEGNYFRLQYGTHALQSGYMTRRELIMMFVLTGTFALAFGALVVLLAAGPIHWIVVFGAALLVFYTWPLKRWGLGEVAVFLVWGPLMVMGTYVAMAGYWSWQVFLLGCVAGLGPTTVVFGKHIDKIDFDRAKGVRTLPVILGEGQARWLALGFTALMYVVPLLLVAIGWLPVPTLLVLLALPLAWIVGRHFVKPAPDEKPLDYPDQVWPLWFAAYAYFHNRWYSLLLLAGLVVAIALFRFGE